MKSFDIDCENLNMPLYKKVFEYAEKEPLRFHMPSHKGIEFSELYKSAKFDITELDFSDNLLQPSGVIRESEKLFAKTYGVDEALMFTGGATSGIFAMLYAVKKVTNKIILSRNSHKSIYNALGVMGLIPCFCDVEYNEFGVPLPVSAKVIEKALEENLDAGAVLITSPDYFGNVCDLQEIKSKIGNRLLLSDSSHGGHFVYAGLENRAELVADISVLSLHKTLNCYTGSAIVLCKNEFYRTLVEGRAIFHSTSPQYLSMCSMDYSRAIFEKCGEKLYLDLYNELEKFDLLKYVNYDFSKLVLRGGQRLAEYLIAQNVYPECVFGDIVLLIVTPFDLDKIGILKSLLDDFVCVQSYCSQTIEFPVVERAVSYESCFAKESEVVSLCDSVGRVSAGEVGLYPPGVPIISRGEVFTKESVEFLNNYKNLLFGVDSEGVSVLK